ncbi:MAG: HAD-IIB family hydrolase [Clostridia bacterium]|nr:HAD-IIB family hydrolase [Clostridia bacterium]
MPIKLIGLDIDGTLLNSQKQLTPCTRSALEAAARAGIRIAYLTGRPLHGVTENIRHAAVSHIVSSNGAATHDAATGALLRGRYIPKDTAHAIAAAAAALGLDCTVFIGGLGYCEPRFYDALMEQYRIRGNLTYGLASRRRTEALPALIEGDAHGVENICVDTNGENAHRAMAAEMTRWPGLRIVTTRGNNGLNLEIGHPEADKGLAFLDLARSLGIAREETLAVGDDGNDLGLLQAAGMAVAMGNATDEVKRACARVVADNDHDGVAELIGEILAGASEQRHGAF